MYFEVELKLKNQRERQTFCHSHEEIDWKTYELSSKGRFLREMVKKNFRELDVKFKKKTE